MTTLPPIDFLIVTALEEERDAVLSQLPSYQQILPTDDDIRVYFASEVPVGNAGRSGFMYRVIVVSSLRPGRVEAANVTSDAIRRWHPKYVLLVGIAGGFASRGAGMGDILVAEQIVDYELQKLEKGVADPRYTVYHSDARLLNFAKNYRGDDWQVMIKARRPRRGKAKRRFGNVASGDKVDADSATIARYGSAWPKLIGVEMEAGGVASACLQSADRPGFFMVRAVSDLADPRKDTAVVSRWRKYAREAAAAFAIALLRHGPIPLAAPPGVAVGPT